MALVISRLAAGPQVRSHSMAGCDVDVLSFSAGAGVASRQLAGVALKKLAGPPCSLFAEYRQHAEIDSENNFDVKFVSTRSTISTVHLSGTGYQHSVDLSSTVPQVCGEAGGMCPPVSPVIMSAGSHCVAVAGPYGQCGGSHPSWQTSHLPTSVLPVESVATLLQFP